MADDIKVEGLDQLNKLADVYRTAEPRLQKAIREGLSKHAKDLEREVIAVGSEKMPARGGLRARIAAAHGGVSVSLAGKSVSVSLTAKTREGYRLRAIDRTGVVRHPVFGFGTKRHVTLATHVKPWAETKVPAHAFTDAFEEGAPKVRADLLAAIQHQLEQIAREV